MVPTFIIILTNDSYSDDMRYSKVFDRVPTRQDVINTFGSIDSGDHNSQTYTILNIPKRIEVGGITVADDEEISFGCLK